MTPEGYVKKAVEDLLKAERIRYWRMNAGDRIVTDGHARRYRIRGHAEGTPDILASVRQGLHNPTLVWIECKAPGKPPTKEQLEFADAARDNYEVWLCIDDVRELQTWLREYRAS